VRALVDRLATRSRVALVGELFPCLRRSPGPLADCAEARARGNEGSQAGRAEHVRIGGTECERHVWGACRRRGPGGDAYLRGAARRLPND
jgi:hypothetical protein